MEFEGNLFVPDYKAKERALRKTISEMEMAMIALKKAIEELQSENELLKERKIKKVLKKKGKINKVRRARYLQTRKGWVKPE